MALDFPNSPSVNDSFSAGGKTWVYNGTKWVLLSVSLNQTVADGAITTAKLADSSITAAKIADGTIVAAEIANNAITTAKILDANVTQAKLGTTLSAVTVTTAANRDTAVASPFTGQLVFLTDTKKIQVWDGTGWLNITLAPPETPTSLSATALSTTSVSIAFTAGGANGSPITNYKYALSTNGGVTYGSFVALDPVDITTPITISGLTPGTTYYIKLKAVNDMGDSVASAAVSIGTLSTPDAPTSLSATPSNTSVSISFTPGAQGGSAITNYQYALSTNGGSSYGSFTALDPADATSPITISGLSQGTAYYVKLKAVNTDGAGTESSAVSFTTTIVIEYLVVAGGGGGGGSDTNGAGNGGAGAGGYRSSVVGENSGRLSSAESVFTISTSTNYTVTIGGGGSGGAQSNYTSGVVGANSVFATITSIGGGNGGSGAVGAGGSGGSGGYGASVRGLGTAGQGFDSGLVTSVGAPFHAAGGGGAGQQGGDAVGTSYAGPGGNGIASSITGSSVYRAGGGGSGNINNSGYSAGGLGGGGTANGNGGTNLGGGGAGGAGRGGGTGGSGVVILRYPSNLTITIGAGLTGSTATVSSNKVTTITAGSGNVSWA